MELNEPLMKPVNPCHRCNTRKAGCHADCTSYCDYKTETEAYNAEIRRRKINCWLVSKRVEEDRFRKVRNPV
jgi:hypothetical protein